MNWFNEVDATYRTDLRELNEINFARFDSKFAERLAEVAAGFARLDGKLEQRLAETKAELRREMATLRTDLQGQIAGLRAELIKWMFVFWVGNVATTAALVFALAHFLRS